MEVNPNELDALIREKGLCRMIEKRAEDWAMYWFVVGMRKAIPNTTIEKAVEYFLKYSCHRTHLKSAIMQFYRLQDEFIEQLRTT